MAYLEQLYDTFKIDLNWLLTGEQSPEQPLSPGSKELIFAPRFDVEASAGTGSLVFNEEISESFAFNKNWLSSQLGVHSEQVAFVTVKGDSMRPTLEDGDLILVDLSQQHLVREGIYLLQTEDGLHTKRLKAHKDGIEVISDNPDYPRWQISATEHSHSRITGKVVWCGRGV
ncbi:S24 family peptidase [Vibrio sp. PP-XX7]